MKRRDFLKVTGIGAAGAATLAAPAIAQSMPEIKWRLTASWPKSLDTLWGGVEVMAKLVAEATDNKFQLQTFRGGEIVPGLQVLDAVQNGTVEMGHTASYYYFGKDPTFAFGTAVPFGPNQRLNQAWYMHGGGRQLLNDFYKSYNVTSFLAGNTGCQMGGWFRKEIKTVEDLNGLKMRIGGFAGRSCKSSAWCRSSWPAATSIRHWRRARSTPPSGSGPMTMRSSASTRSRRTITSPDGGKAARCCSASSIWTSGIRCRKTIKASSSRQASTANSWMMAKYDQLNPQSMKKLLAGGTKLHAFSPPIMQACLKATKELYAETTASNANFKKVLDSLNSFNSNGYQWWQVAELGYDSFMSRNAQG